MRKLFLSAMALLILRCAYAQSNMPSGETSVPPPASPLIPHAGTDYAINSLLNYVREWTPQKPMDDELEVVAAGQTVEEVHRTTQYFDGFGRPIQTVAWQQSSVESKCDMVNVIEYDEYGRQPYQYLSFASSQVNGTGQTGTGGFKYNAFSQYAAFSNSQYPEETYNGKQFNYNHSIFESAVLDRITKTFAPGNSWAGSEASNSEKMVRTQYLVNDATLQVRIWDISNSALTYDAGGNITSTLNIPTSTATYGVGQLFKLITTDEDGKQAVEYRNKENEMVLKKIQSDATNWLYTYYVYDDAGMLRFVIPPKATAALANWTVTTDIADELCFHYEYDSRGRLIAKKIPGAGWTYYVYDKRDRLVYTQDAKMRSFNSTQGQWMTVLYDIENRPITTGMLQIDKTISTQAAHQYLITTMDNLDYSTYNIALGQTSFANPLYGLIGSPSFIPLTKTHYDNYNYVNVNGTSPSPFDINQEDNLQLLDPNSVGVESNENNTTMILGDVTGTEVRVIENANDLSVGMWLITTNYYDYKNRLLQSVSSNYKGGLDVVTNLYDFTGKILSNFVDHTISPTIHHGVASDFDYDQVGRILKIKKRIFNGGILIQAVKIADNTYNKLGQLEIKMLGQQIDQSTGNYTIPNPMETLTYEYNIRGWLRSINKDYVTGNGSNSWFGMQLSYDWGFNINNYNGNISGTTWRSKGDGQRRAYGFGYDQANRTLFADFNQYTNSTWNKNAGLDFSATIGDGVNVSTAYDENGNIIHMKEIGVFVNSTGLVSSAVDDLSYTYFTNTNKLQAVGDAAAGVPVGMGDFNNKNTGATDYGYDVNGNLISDLNKNIAGPTGKVVTNPAAILYNYLNLPWKITMYTDGNTLIKGTTTYIYDAVGNKIEKRVDELASSSNNNTETKTNTTYIGVYTYQTVTTVINGSSSTSGPNLQYISDEEGRIREENNSDGSLARYDFDYFIKDHLGNIRMVLTDQLKTEIAAATMEVSQENQLFYNWDITKWATNQIAHFPNPQTNPNVSRTYSGTESSRVGLVRVIKVMSGDVVTASVKSFYSQTTTTNDGIRSWQNIATQLFNALFSNSTLPSALSNLHGTPTDIGTLTLNQASPFIGSSHTVTAENTGKPKAYLNILVYDEFFHLSTTLSQAVYACPQSAASYILTPVSANPITIKNNGYVYVYLSNESTEDVEVFWDDLNIQQIHGPLVEESHYYPFGLNMSGISSSALNFGQPESKYGFRGKELQNKEFSDNSGLELYDFGARDQDPQIGRWWAIDPKAEKYLSSSPYDFVDDNPISRIDPTGQDWFYYQSKDEKEASWHWNKGHKATYTNTDGKNITTKNGYKYLVTFTYDQGQTWGGAPRGTLTVYNQNKVVSNGSAFSGAGWWTGGFDETAKGNYMMNLSDRSVMPKVNYSSDEDNHNPPANYGMQKIEDGTIIKYPDGSTRNVNSDYGNYRIRLKPTDGSTDRGLYLHGKDAWYNSRTHGCVCEKDQVVLQYIWNDKEMTGNVPFAVDQTINTPPSDEQK